ncbi:short tail fiber protein [Serratia phage vB_SmaM-Yubaba]|nr:putative short tail fiber protein [Serratia phage vB_SmaM-Sureiya]UQT03240.1 short tail fiber protein [Serratia phage vB_SmaM-Yubaba]
MSKDSRVQVSGKIVYPWNPFQDLADCRITNESAHVEGGDKGTIIVPRNGPFFSRNFVIKKKGSDRPLSMEAGEYSFIHPFGAFIKRYNRLVWGAIVVKGVATPTDYVIEYDTIGGDFVLNDAAYAAAVANTLTAPRTIDWNDIVNLPLVWPPDPHDHPASDTMNYGDLIAWMQSYLDAITDNDTSVSFVSEFKAHLEADLQHAHKATLEMLGVAHLKDWAMATTDDIQGNSTELLINMAVMKEAIRGYSRGDWR